MDPNAPVTQAGLAGWAGPGAGLDLMTALSWPIATMQPGEARDSYSSGAGVMIACAATALESVKVNALGCLVTTGGVTGSGVNGLMLAGLGGNPLGVTGSMTSAFGSTGYAIGNLTAPVEVEQGQTCYLCLLAHFSGSDPGIAGRAGPALPVTGVWNVRPALIFTGVSALQQFDPAAGSAFPGCYFLFGQN